MSVFPDWQIYAVHQRRSKTGCIPTGYEMILRAAGAKGIDFGKFQDEFDLDINLGLPQTQPRNHFGSVASEVRKKYPWVDFAYKSFTSGADKVAFIDKQLSKQQPVLISLAQEPYGGTGWHIMPVVDATNTDYLFLEYKEANGSLKTRWISKSEVASIHDQYAGGCEVAFLSRLDAPN